MACSGSNGSASLRSAAVPGMNCATPCAPAWLLTLGRKLLSCQISRVKKSTGMRCAFRLRRPQKPKITEVTMKLSRRSFVGGALAAPFIAQPGFGQARGSVLRVIPHADLKNIDPIWTTAYITRNHGYLVYDTLFGTDESLQIKPQMVDRTTVSPDRMKYTFALRDGLRWHDGQPVVSEDCVESLKRWGKKDRFGQLLMAHTGRITPVDKKTFTLELAERFGPVLEALGPLRAPF